MPTPLLRDDPLLNIRVLHTRDQMEAAKPAGMYDYG